MEGLKTQAGEFEFSLWWTTERRKKLFDDDGGGPSNTKPSTLERPTRIQQTYIDLSYGVSESWTLMAGTSYLNNSTPDGDKIEELGDSHIGVRYTIGVDWEGSDPSDENDTGWLSISAGLQIPTGSVEEPEVEDEISFATLQAGTGTWDPLFGLTYSHRVFGLHSFCSLSTRISGGENRKDYETGSSVLFNLGTTIPIEKRVSFTPKLGWLHREVDRIDGHRATASGGEWLTFTPILSLQPSQQTTIQIQVQIPLYRDLEQEQTDSPAQVGFGMSYRF